MADIWGYDVGRQDAVIKQRVRGASDCVYPSLIFSTEKSRGRRRLTVLEHQEPTERAIEMSIEIHRKTGPGLIESVYAAFKCLELEQAGISLSRTNRLTRSLSRLRELDQRIGVRFAIGIDS